MRRAWKQSALWIAVGLTGTILRLIPWAAFRGVGFDESLYDHYLKQLLQVGLVHYPDIVDRYVDVQKMLVGSILPPTRFLYIFAAYGWHGLFGGEPIAAFYAVSRASSVALLLVAGAFARRLAGARQGLAVFALVAFSPLALHFAQHALVDGFFALWAMLTLWALWECLQRPGHRGWLALYTIGLACMVTTKENAFFVFIAILALLALNWWLRFGAITPALLALTIIGPLIGVAVLVNLAGGVRALIGVYTLSVPKNLTLEYAIMTGDGPWHRYLIDLVTISPLVFVLACASVLNLRRDDRALWFLTIFVASSYALMCNVKYGMNLRYASIWDVPLRVLAVAQTGALAARFGRWESWAFAALIVGLCAVDISQYYRMAVEYPLYELVTGEMLKALQILK